MFDVDHSGESQENRRLVMSPKIIFAIHDAHPWGGQDKYTLEIARWIAKKKKVELHAFSLHGEGAFVFKQVRPLIRRPVLLKSLFFHVYTFLAFRNLKSAEVLVNAMGASSLRSDVVQVLFLHKAWAELQNRNPEMAANYRGLLQKIYHFFLQKYDLWTERLAFRPEKKYIAISKTVGSEVTTYFPEIKSVDVVYPGIDPAIFAPIDLKLPAQRNLSMRQSIGIGSEIILFLFVGSFERKGLAAVLKSLQKLSSKNWSLAVVGKGDIPQYRAFAEDLGIADQVHFFGSRKDVASFYQAANFFIFPTRYEPFGMVVLEAMACGCIPIVSASAGAAELVEDQKNGFLISDETSVDEISKILNRVVADPSKWSAIAGQARATAENYSWEKVADRYLEILERNSLA